MVTNEDVIDWYNAGWNKSGKWPVTIDTSLTTGRYVTTAEHFGVDDFLTIGLILLGQPTLGTRGKPRGTTQGTSPLSQQLRHYLDIETRRLPTLTTGSIKRLEFSYVTNLGAFVGRWIPILGIIIIAADVSTIAYKATNKYNTIARGNDKLW